MLERNLLVQDVGIPEFGARNKEELFVGVGHRGLRGPLATESATTSAGVIRPKPDRSALRLRYPTVSRHGDYHGGSQDLRFGLRYKLVTGRAAVTPFVVAIVPSRDYEFYAHSAVGQQLRGFSVGTSLGKLLEVLPGTFVQGRYSYTFLARPLGIAHNRSNADLEVGHFINPSLRVFGLVSGQFTHGGFDITFDQVLSRTGEVLSQFDVETGEILFGAEYDLHHDRIDRAHFLNVGAGAAFSLNDSVDLFGSMVKAVAVRNGHAVNKGFTVGVSWTVRRRTGSSALPEVDEQSASARRSLVRCSC